jgi:flagella basal body P-ring formation protein FlgA
MIRHAAVTAFLAFALPAAIGAAEFTPRPTNATVRAEQFLDRFGGEPTSTPAAQEAPKSPARPTLKAEATVLGNIVRIGDLIENAGAAADVAIFRAPDIGQTGIVPVIRVIDAVLPHRIVGLDTRDIAEVAVTRASRLITVKDIEARIARALADQPGLANAKSLSVKFDNDVRTLKVEAAATAELRIVRLGYEPRNSRFDVTFDLPGSTVVHRHPLRFTGSIVEMFEAIVPTREIARGEVLNASDLTLALRPKSDYAPTVVLNAEQAIGLSPKRSLPSGQAIRQSDLAKPQLIARNETVTITYAVPGIVVSIRGQALESGGHGDLINVLNVQSKKTIQATVSGPGRVSVAAMTPRLADAAPSSNNARQSAE